RRASGSVRVGDDLVIDRNREFALHAPGAVRGCYSLAAVSGRLGVVPLSERVVRVVADAALTLTRQVLEGDRPVGGRAVPRQVEEEPLGSVVVFVVARVVRVQDPVDPVLGAGGRRP